MLRISHRHLTTATLIGAAALVAACSSKDKTADSTSASTTTTSTNTSTATSATPGAAGADSMNGGTAGGSAGASAGASDPAHFSDANILAKEIAGDSAEVTIATMAKGMASSAAVKSYAAQLVADHSKGMKEATALAGKASITPQAPPGDTTAQSTEHTMSRLQGLQKGAAFDSAFVNHEIEDHQQDIKDAEAMSGAAQNAQVKALVQKALPELKKHLAMAQKLAKK